MTEYPSLPDQGKNLAKFTFEVLKKAMSSNALFVSDEVKEERLKICRTCEYYDPDQVRCKHCGCFLEHKAGYALDSCPISKWEESDSEWIAQGYDEVLDAINNPQPEVDEPLFPIEPEVGQTYGWKDRKWKWNGSMWEYIEE